MIYTTDDVHALAAEIVDEWGAYNYQVFGVHSEVWIDNDTGELWFVELQQNETASYQFMNCVKVADVRRPDDFDEYISEYGTDDVVEEAEGAIWEGLYSLGF